MTDMGLRRSYRPILPANRVPVTLDRTPACETDCVLGQRVRGVCRLAMDGSPLAGSSPGLGAGPNLIPSLRVGLYATLAPD